MTDSGLSLSQVDNPELDYWIDLWVGEWRKFKPRCGEIYEDRGVRTLSSHVWCDHVDMAHGTRFSRSWTRL